MTHPVILVRQNCLDPNGLSLTDAAQVLGCNRRTISNLLNDRFCIYPKIALRFEKAFGTSARHRMARQVTHKLKAVIARAQ